MEGGIAVREGPIQLRKSVGKVREIAGNHLEERLLDQAQARASYTPLFWGHSLSIPQGMILDVQPLVKSLFCPIRASPNGFFDFEASTPLNLDITFLRGGGGSKVFAQKATSSGEAQPSSYSRRSNGNASDAKFAVGGSNPGLLTFGAGGGAKFTRSGFEPPTADVLPDALPLGHWVICAEGPPRWLGPHLPLTKNPNCVYVSDCLPACWLRD